MYTLILPGGSVSLYDSPYLLPEYQRTEYDYYRLIHSAIGSTSSDVDRHFDLMAGLVGSDDHNAQLNAINNTRYLLFNLTNRQTAPNVLALCCLVESVNGQPWRDYSPKGVEELARKLSDLGINQEIVESANKLYSEVIAPLQELFPEQFPDHSQDANLRLVKAMLLEIDEFLTPDDPGLTSRQEDLQFEIVESLKPPLMAGKGNVLDKIRKAYRSNKIALESEWSSVSDTTPSVAFWNYIVAMQEKYRKQPPALQEAEL